MFYSLFAHASFKQVLRHIAVVLNIHIADQIFCLPVILFSLPNYVTFIIFSFSLQSLHFRPINITIACLSVSKCDKSNNVDAGYVACVINITYYGTSYAKWKVLSPKSINMIFNTCNYVVDRFIRWQNSGTILRIVQHFVYVICFLTKRYRTSNDNRLHTLPTYAMVYRWGKKTTVWI